MIGPETVRYLKYPVQKGDTVYSIAQRFGASTNEILRTNRISDPRTLVVGTTLRIPLTAGKHPTNRAPGSSSRRPSNTAESPPLAVDAGSRQAVLQSRARHYIGQLGWPAKVSEISSTFGKRWFSFHEGIDIRGPIGTDILAAHDGQVVYSDDQLRGYGNLVIVRGEGLLTVYAHNDRNRVRVGEAVSRGEHIADLGQSGKATGPHLHFEVRIQDNQGKYAAVDPLVFYDRK